MTTGASVFEHMTKGIEEVSEQDRKLAVILRDLLAEGERGSPITRARRARKIERIKAEIEMNSETRASLEAQRAYIKSRKARAKAEREASKQQQ